jgi:pimeloyl-ACP methyl ester carboxylesterase
LPSLKVNDIRIHYTEHGDGPTVLVLHAATAEGAAMSWLATAIAREGFNVVLPDQRGHGATPNPAPDLHMPRLVDDMLEFVYLLGRTPLHGVGYSLGGAVLLYAALRRPEFFRSLVVLGTNYRAPAPERLDTILGPLADRPPDQRAAFHPETGIVAGWDEPLAVFKAVTCPVLIICADRDEFNDPQDGLALYRTLPNAGLLVVPHTDHLGLVRHPVILEAVRAFYTRVPR